MKTNEIRLINYMIFFACPVPKGSEEPSHAKRDEFDEVKINFHPLGLGQRNWFSKNKNSSKTM